MDPCHFQDDNARCHVSWATMQWYADNNVRRLDWPAQSPDLNPIEHLWDELDRRVRARQARPKSIAQLIEWLQEEWRRIPVDVLQTLVESMPDRVAVVIDAREWCTPRNKAKGGTHKVVRIEKIQKSGRKKKGGGINCSNPMHSQFPLLVDGGGAVTERLACPPPTKANRVQSPAGLLLDFRMWESCRTMPLVGGTSRGYPPPPRRCSILTSTTLICSQDLARHDGDTARLARKSDESLEVRVSVARIAPSLLDLGIKAPPYVVPGQEQALLSQQAITSSQTGGGGRETLVHQPRSPPPHHIFSGVTSAVLRVAKVVTEKGDMQISHGYLCLNWPRERSHVHSLPRPRRYDVREHALWSPQFVGQSAKERQQREGTNLVRTRRRNILEVELLQYFGKVRSNCERIINARVHAQKTKIFGVRLQRAGRHGASEPNQHFGDRWGQYQTEAVSERARCRLTRPVKVSLRWKSYVTGRVRETMGAAMLRRRARPAAWRRDVEPDLEGCTKEGAWLIAPSAGDED
ncbi:hypothetical protein PR048_031463 [Dryococelus australis]|uniref:Tc1-like transposase DDE domain-containing protein n=1 Tax=Dryococelus australis TaxID=614101 RepID=A0ABQ9G5C4_9NEOP|nr:hypothetical protein PR048_031463 [Dryococelus australis]